MRASAFIRPVSKRSTAARRWPSVEGIIAVSALLSGCAFHGPSHGPAPVANAGGGRGGAYYQDDGPGEHPPADLAAVPDAVPRREPYAKGANRPYTVFGVEYTPDVSDRPFLQRGVGSWYGRKFHGQRTSSGEPYDMYAMTAAHPTLPIPSYARVTNIANGRSVVVRVNDRGPFLSNRIIDLSYTAAYRLGYVSQGSTMLQVERILPRDIESGRWAESPPTTSEPRLASAPAAAAPTLPAAGAGFSNPAPVEFQTGPGQEPPVDETLPEDLRPVQTVSVTSGAASGQPAKIIPVSVPQVHEQDGQGGYFLQLGAFRVRAGADSFSERLISQLDAQLAPRLRIVSRGAIYRVQLGPYSSRSEADRAADRLKDELNLPATVVSGG